MMINSIVFNNAIPHVTINGILIKVDLGTIIIEMSRMEWETLRFHVQKHIDAFLASGIRNLIRR